MTQAQKTWSAIVGAGLVILGVGTYVAVNDTGSEERTTSTTPLQSVNISSEGEVPLTFQMSTSTVDICFTGNPSSGRERLLLVEPWLSEQKALGFQRAAIHGDGSISQVSHVAIPPAIGHGYNGRQSDFKTYAEFKECMNGVLVQPWVSDFFPSTVAFVNALGIPADVTLNKRDTWKENKYRIDQTGAEYIFLWSEVKILDQYGETWKNYLPWAKQMRDSINKYYTGKKIIADEPNIFQGDRVSLEWRANINPTSLAGIYGADNYWQSGDQAGYTSNQDSNILRVRNYLEVTMPAQMTEFKRLFPGWKMIAGQVQPEDRRDSQPIYIINYIAADLFWSGMYESCVENQDFQPMAIQQAMKNCSDPDNTTTRILTLLNSTLKPGSKVTKLSFTGMPDCTGYSLRYGSPPKNHVVVINNWSRATYALSEIQFDGKKKTPTVTAIHHTSDTWGSQPIKRDTTVSETFTIVPGITVLNYTLK